MPVIAAVLAGNAARGAPVTGAQLHHQLEQIYVAVIVADFLLGAIFGSLLWRRKP